MDIESLYIAEDDAVERRERGAKRVDKNSQENERTSLPDEE